MTDLKDLIIPTKRVISTMLAGHLVDCEIIEQATFEKPTITCRFIRHHDSGTENLCLDFGQGWNIRRGEEFTTRLVNIQRAAELIAEAVA